MATIIIPPVNPTPPQATATIVQQPTALSLSGNLAKFIISSRFPVLFILRDGNETLLDASYTPNQANRVTIDVQELIESRLSYQISSLDFFRQQNLAKTFTAIINNGQPINFRVIRAGVDNLSDTAENWLRRNFLTWQPAIKKVTYFSQEWLTYYPVSEDARWRMRAHFANGINRLFTLATITSGTARIPGTMNMQYAIIADSLGDQPTHYEVWVETLAGARLSNIQTYVFSEPNSETEQWFFFENSLGGLDTLRTYGNAGLDAEHNHKIANIGDVSSEYAVDTIRTFSQNTGHLNEFERRWLLDFFPAKRKYILRAGRIRPIIITDSDVGYNASGLPSDYNFKYRFADNSSALLNLVRNVGTVPENLTIPNPQSPDFYFTPPVI